MVPGAAKARRPKRRRLFNSSTSARVAAVMGAGAVAGGLQSKTWKQIHSAQALVCLSTVQGRQAADAPAGDGAAVGPRNGTSWMGGTYLGFLLQTRQGSGSVLDEVPLLAAELNESHESGPSGFFSGAKSCNVASSAGEAATNEPAGEGAAIGGGVGGAA